MADYKVESVELHITDACAHKCPYCYADAKITSTTRYADYGSIVKVIDSIAASGAKVVALLGGDPVLHPRFFDIAAHVKKRSMNVACMSNTMSVAGYSPKQLVEVVDSIYTTIHGVNAEAHDRFCCCNGAYDLLTQNLEAFSHLGVTVNIVVNIIPQTYDKVYDIVKGVCSRNVKVTTLLTQRILPFGRAEGTSEYDVTAAQANVSFSQIERAVEDFGIDVSVEDPYPLCCIDEKYWGFMHGCPEGTTRIAINMDGAVSRCGAVPDYSIGNVLTRPINDIWRESVAFNNVRSCSHLTLPECVKCSFRERCCGGCPVHCEMCNKSNTNFITSFRGF